MILNNCALFKALIIIFISLHLDLKAQVNVLNGKTFQSVDEPSIYKYYDEKFVYIFWIYKEDINKRVDVDTLSYGFYNSCELPSLENMKQSGIYYFEVDSSDFVDAETANTAVHNACGELNIFNNGKDTLMNIYYNSRQQYATYRKVNALPKNVRAFLKKKGIELRK